MEIAKEIRIFSNVVVCKNIGDPDCINSKDNLLHVADLETEIVAFSLAGNSCCECPYLMAEGSLAWLKNSSEVMKKAV